MEEGNLMGGPMCKELQVTIEGGRHRYVLGMIRKKGMILFHLKIK